MLARRSSIVLWSIKPDQVDILYTIQMIMASESLDSKTFPLGVKKMRKEDIESIPKMTVTHGKVWLPSHHRKFQIKPLGHIGHLVSPRNLEKVLGRLITSLETSWSNLKGGSL